MAVYYRCVVRLRPSPGKATAEPDKVSPCALHSDPAAALLGEERSPTCRQALQATSAASLGLHSMPHLSCEKLGSVEELGEELESSDEQADRRNAEHDSRYAWYEREQGADREQYETARDVTGSFPTRFAFALVFTMPAIVIDEAPSRFTLLQPSEIVFELLEHARSFGLHIDVATSVRDRLMFRIERRASGA